MIRNHELIKQDANALERYYRDYFYKLYFYVQEALVQDPKWNDDVGRDVRVYFVNFNKSKALKDLKYVREGFARPIQTRIIENKKIGDYTVLDAELLHWSTQLLWTIEELESYNLKYVILLEEKMMQLNRSTDELSKKIDLVLEFKANLEPG